LKSNFYTVLSQMAGEASLALSDYEAGHKDNQIFDKLKAVGVACLEGSDKLDPSIVEDLGPRRRLDFQRAVFTLAGLYSLTTGRGANANVINSLYNIKALADELKVEAEAREGYAQSPVQPPFVERPEFVHRTRIEDLRNLRNSKFDLKRLIRLLEELNIAFKGECYMATAMLVRAIADHVPPVFGFKTFSEVTSNYGGAKSFKGSMLHLQNSLRNIADAHLHLPIRSSETLPTEVQVDFRRDLDVLIGEIIRVLQSPQS
jgi:hypothetical protein